MGYAQNVIKKSPVKNEPRADTSILQQVIITNNSAYNKVRSSQMGEELVSAMEAKNLPAILGEVDIVKILQLKPGVKNAGEGLAGFYVRGGGADQNLVTLDGVPIYNANHLLGLFSIFNNDAIQDVRLYKSAYPAKYGGRLSSVLDVTSRPASMDSFSIRGGVGLLSSRLSVESPIKKGKSSIVISARRTYLDLITNKINNLNRDKENYENIPAYSFSEFNLRSDFRINARNTIWTTAFLGADNFYSSTEDYPVKFRWGNQGASLNWKSSSRGNFSSTSSVFYSGYRYHLGNRYSFNDVAINSGIQTVGLNLVFAKSGHSFLRSHAGINVMHHKMTIGDYSHATAITSIQSGERKSGTELAAFINSEWDKNKKLAMAGGLRVSGFIAGRKWYINPEPRISARFMIDNNSAVKASYTRMYQYLHLASLSSVSLPVDVWHPTTDNTKPQYADQVSVGYSRTIGSELYMNVEGYYKRMGNQVEFRDGTDLIGNPRIENDFVFGKAKAYGIETYLEKKSGHTRGWIGYTMAWASRTFADINDGMPFKPRYDRRHDVSFVMMHKISRTFAVSLNWIYGSGAYTTLPVGRYVMQNDAGVVSRSVVPIFESRNNYQLKPVHRLDLNLVTSIRSKRGKQDITFSLYNAYSRRNPFYVQFKEITDKEGYVISFYPKVVSLFPILPGITYNFKF
jgi:outer membrane cobalamin receptor